MKNCKRIQTLAGKKRTAAEAHAKNQTCGKKCVNFALREGEWPQKVAYNLCVVAPIPDDRKGVFLVLGISFVISVVAGVVANYISKWLDGNDSDN